MKSDAIEVTQVHNNLRHFEMFTTECRELNPDLQELMPGTELDTFQGFPMCYCILWNIMQLEKKYFLPTQIIYQVTSEKLK